MRRRKVVVVHDKMQSGYRYVLAEPPGRYFDPGFRPDLTPKQMLALAAFGGKYITDCRKEFPSDWFRRAKLSPPGRDPANELFWSPCQSAFIRVVQERLDSFGGSARLVQWYCRYYPGHRSRTEGLATHNCVDEDAYNEHRTKAGKECHQPSG